MQCSFKVTVKYSVKAFKFKLQFWYCGHLTVIFASALTELCTFSSIYTSTVCKVCTQLFTAIVGNTIHNKTYGDRKQSNQQPNARSATQLRKSKSRVKETSRAKMCTPK